VLESQILLCNLWGLLCLDVVKASKRAHQMLSVLASVEGSATGREYKIVDLAERFLVRIKAAEPNHSLVRHEPSAIVEGFVNTIWLVQHFHNVIVVNTRRFFNLDLLFLHDFNEVRLDLVMQRQLNNLSVLNRIKLLRVLLKHSRVTCYNLELMGWRVTALFTVSRHVLLQHHFFCLFNVFDDIQVVCLQSL